MKCERLDQFQLLRPMRNLLFIATLLFFSTIVSGQDYGLYWKYKDYGGITFSVGSPLIDLGSLFLDEKSERKLLRKVNKVRVMVFEDETNPVTEKDLNKFARKAKRRHLDELITIRDGKTRVMIYGKERRGAFRKLVILVQSPEEFIMVSVKGNLKWKEVNKVLEKYSKQKKDKPGKDSPKTPIKIPVIRA